MCLAYTLSDCSAAHTYNILQHCPKVNIILSRFMKLNKNKPNGRNMIQYDVHTIYHGNILVIYCSSNLLVAPEFHHGSGRGPSPSNGMAMGHGCGAVAAGPAGRSGHGADGAVRAGRSIDTLPPMAMGYPKNIQKSHPKNGSCLYSDWKNMDGKHWETTFLNHEILPKVSEKTTWIILVINVL